MRKHLAIASAVALFAGASVAMAEEEATGTLLQVDDAAGVITLEDGSTYTFDDDVDVTDLQAGQEVTVSYEEGEDGQMRITSISASEGGMGMGLEGEDPAEATTVD